MFIVRTIDGQTFSEIYREILWQLLYNPEYVSSPRGYKTHEIMNCVIRIEDPSSNMFKNKIRSTPPRYLAGELWWYFSGSNLLEDIAPYSKFWDKIKNPDGKTVNSAYGNLLFREYHTAKVGPGIDTTDDFINEWQWALGSLTRDKDSRQAILRFNKPWHSWWGNKDFVCTLTGIFNIRNDKLHFTVIMRSQDEIFGRTFDVPFFTLLQQQMWRHLQREYPNLQLGTYTQHNISTHLYERDFEKVNEMLKHPFDPDGTPILFNDLIQPDGKFHLENFATGNDPLIDWIKENMK